MSELPTGWAIAAIGDVCGAPEQRVPAVDEKFTYIDIASVDRDLKVVSEPQTLLGAAAPSRARKLVENGDVIVSMTRPNLNAVALIDDKHAGAIASTGFDVLKPVEVEPRWIFAAVRSAQFIDAMSEKVQGALYPAVKSSDVRSHEIPLPPLAEQKRIAQKLDALLAQVDTLKARIDTIPALLKRFRQSVLANAISGDATAMWRKKFDADKPEEKKFEDLLHDRKQLSYGVLKPGDFDPQGVPMIRVMDLDERGSIDTSNVYRISKTLSHEFKRTALAENDIILSVMATIGRAALVPASMAGGNVNRALAVIKLRLDISPKFVLYLLMSPQFQAAFVEKQLGSAQRRINLSDLREFPVRLPTPPEQAEIVRRIEQLFAFADQLEAKVASTKQRIDTLTQSILAKAFRGELVLQDPDDEPASVLLERIRANTATALSKRTKKSSP